MSIESTQVLINSARQYTNLEDYKNALTQALTALNEGATSGTWTPSITNQSGAATITVIGTSRYTQICSFVTYICRLSVEMDTGQSLEEFNLSCAVLPSTNFASARDIIPFWSAISSMPEFDTVFCGAVTSQKYGIVSVTMNGTAIAAEFTVQRTYSIL